MLMTGKLTFFLF